MIRTKDDLKNSYGMYDTLDSMYHRYGLDCEAILYVDNSYGELLPFFNIKSHKTIFYHNVQNADVLRYGLMSSAGIKSKVSPVDVESHEMFSHKMGKCELAFTNCNERMIASFIDVIAINGFLLTTFNCDSDRLKGFAKLGNMNGVYLYKRVDAAFVVKSSNAFSTLAVLKNKFTYQCTSSADVSLNVFHIGLHNIRIIGLRMDDNSPCKVKVQIHSLEESESVELLFSMDNALVCQSEYDIPFKVFAVGLNEQKIPRVICQTLNQRVTTCMHFKTILNIQMLNPEYVYEFFNARDRKRFIVEHFDNDVLDTYDGLVSGAFKADLFRYCWLYIKGGIYMDCKMIQRIPWRDMIEPEDSFYLCQDRIPNAYQNCVIAACSKQPDLLKCISECVKRFQAKINHRVSFGSLYHTGPYLFHHCMQQHSTKAAFRGSFRDLSYDKTGIFCKKTDVLLFNVWFKDYYKNYEKIHGKQMWSREWADGNIYYSKKFEIENTERYSIRVHPSHSLSNLEELEFTYEEGGHIYNNSHDNLRCQLFDEDEHVDQTIEVKKR